MISTNEQARSIDQADSFKQKKSHEIIMRSQVLAVASCINFSLQEANGSYRFHQD
jgi:hypothetical protein